MMFISKINVWTLIFLCIGKANCIETEAKEDLVQSESKDGTLEIIKQIKKVNNDGSYTVGYEADDGSFKIESRDVLGNIKGTYGYIDDTGKIKRVSYSSANSSDIVHHDEGDTVVQRIPKLNISSTTSRPYHSSTASSIQNLVKKKHNSVSSTTVHPVYTSNGDSESKSTTRTHLVYATTPRSRFLLKSSESSRAKHEGQLPRPEESDRPTEIPLFRRLAAKHPVADIKPVTEEPELKSNILRRQLPRDNDYDPHQHVHSLQQSLGNDSPDVYSASMTTGTPRPLFTTTYRPVRLSTTASPIRRATVRYPKNLQSSSQHKEDTTISTEEEESNEQSPVSETTPTTVPVVQIPANRPQPETLVAIRHPYQRNTVLVPLSYLQRRLVPFASPRDINDNIQGYVPQLEHYSGEPTSNPGYDQEAPRPEYARRLPSPPLRPMPVQIDENGYVREYPQQSLQQKYVAVPVQVPPKYVQEVSSNTIENIQPPVSIRDFQVILQQLELRQKRLERLHELTDPRRNQDYQQKRNFQSNHFYQRFPQSNPNNVVQFIPNPDIQRRRHYESLRGRSLPYQDQQNQYDDEQFAQSYVPTKRVARLLKNQGNEEEYLPVDVREMLLLKMLQLAINPALPSDSEESESVTTPVNYFKKDPSRNVEILGEEQESSRRPSRVKRFKGTDDLEYTD